MTSDGDASLADLAARIAAIEASSTAKVPGPRARSADDTAAAGRGAVQVGVGDLPGGEARTQAELDAARAAASGEPVGASGGLGGAASGGDGEPALPERDVDDVRGPSLVSLEGQLAHDEALGVAPDGSSLEAAAAAAQRPKRKKKEPKAELAFADAAPHQRAIDLAYKLVSRREHTVKQVRDKLAAKACEPAAIDEAIAELGRYGFIDDERYAKLFAEDKRRLQGWGARRIRMKLTQDGISRDLLDRLFADDEEALDAPSELEVALALLHRKQPDLSDVKVKSRMAGMLARRGIASSVVFQAIRQHERGED
ncbi:MAG: regulatory protein RecX [Solirubrobacteraceae bacterium]|nr:regulatory protein RecX [Patulibacter sp.]